MEFSLVKEVMSEVKRRRTRGFGSKPTLWASQASAKQADGTILGKCIRSGFYEKLGLEKTNPVSSAVTIMGYMGIQIEDGLIELIKRTGIWENNNVKWQANGVSGEVDIIINTQPGAMFKDIPLTKGQLIVECKSCSGYHANKHVYGHMSGRGEKKVWNPGSPKIKHLMQSALYADVSKDKTDGCLVIYVSRDEAKMCEFLVQVDDEGKIYINGIPELRFTMHDIYSRYEELRVALDTLTCPEPDYKHTYTDAEVEALFARKGISATAKNNHLNGTKVHMDADCRYCNYRDKCVADGPNRIENYAPVDLPAPTPEEQQVDDLFGDATVPVTKPTEKPGYMMHGSF